MSSANWDNGFSAFDDSGKRWRAGSSAVLASGGEGVVFKLAGGLLAKMMLDPAAFSARGGAERIRALSLLSLPCAALPVSPLFSDRGVPIGILLPFREGEPLMSAFSSAWRARENFSNADALRLVERMREALLSVHAVGCVVSDGSENNWRISSSREPFLIDCDSWGHGPFRPTAITPSISDPLLSGPPSQSSDWFAFAVLAFQIIVGMHPFKGRHPAFPKGTLAERMQAGASLLDDGCGLPPSARPISDIPPRLRAWLSEVFGKKLRTPPPSDLGAPVLAARPLSRVSSGRLSKSVVRRLGIQARDVFPLAAFAYAVDSWSFLDGSAEGKLPTFLFDELRRSMAVPVRFGKTLLFVRTCRSGIALSDVSGTELDSLSSESDRLFETPMGVLAFSSPGKAFFVEIREIGGRMRIFAGDAWEPPSDNPLCGNGAMLFPLPSGFAAATVSSGGIRVASCKLPKGLRPASVFGTGRTLFVFGRDVFGERRLVLLRLSAKGIFEVTWESSTDFSFIEGAVSAEKIVACIDDGRWIVARESDGAFSVIEDDGGDGSEKLFFFGDACCRINGDTLERLTFR